jgi:FAD/FMN-containing dehydrogenase
LGRLNSWRRSWRGSPERSFGAVTRYLNYFSEDDVGDEATRRAYGPNYERLVDVKDVYDPTNLFRLNTNVRPSP